MNESIARTKVIPPRRIDLYSRPRLIELFHELMPSKLIILVAPAGYGKTYALIDFVQHTTMPVCWYAVDGLDRDTHRFFAHLIASIGQRYPTFGPASQAALYSLSAGEITLDQFVVTIVNELYECIDEEFLVIVDDYHQVEENDTIGAFFSQFIQHVDEHCHVLLASRRLLALPDMPLLVARGYVAGLDYEDLVFENKEVQELILQNFGQTLHDEEVSELVKATEGWITGLLLSTQSQMRNLTERMRRLRAAGVDLYGYLAQQVLDQQPEVLRTFLLRTSFFDEFDAAFCRTILGDAWLPPGESWTHLVEQVLRRNLFAVPVDETGAWVRYHNLFQEFLQKLLIRERPEEEVIILNRLALHHRAQEQWEKAHRCYRELNDFEAIADLIEQAGRQLLRRGRMILLADWLTNLPKEIVHSRPVLLSLRGDVLVHLGELQEGMALLNQAALMFRDGTEVKERAYNLARRSFAHRLLGNYHDSLADADEVLALAAGLEASQRETNAIRAFALHSKGLSLHLTGRLDESVHCLQEALALYQAQDNAQVVAAISTDIAMVYSALGRVEKAQTLFQQALEIWRRLSNIYSQSFTLNNLGVLYHLRGNYSQALALLEEAHDCAQRSGNTRLVATALSSIGDLFADLEMWESARKIYMQAFQIARKINERFLLLYLQLVMVRLSSALGNWKQAFDHLNTASQMVLDRKSRYEWALYQLAMGRYYLAQGKLEEALPPLQDAQMHFAETGQPTEEATACCYSALVLHGLNDDEAAAALLRQGLETAFQLENRHPLVVALREAKDILALPALKGVVRELARQIGSEIAAFEQEMPVLSRQLRRAASPAMATFLAETPPRLIIRALGRTEVQIDGKLVTTKEWQTQVSRDLFFCILAHNDGMTKEEIAAWFWPDASPDNIKTRFKNAIYRLRSALDANVILFENDLYRFNHDFDYDYDVENFVRKVAEGDNATDAQVRITAYLAASQLYEGPYLPDVDGAWAVAERERFERTFIETVYSLAQLQFDTGDYRGALRTCQRALARDPCQEDMHRLAMRIYAAQGNRAAVARQYALCQQALREEIDVPPSPQTEHLYSLLMHA